MIGHLLGASGAVEAVATIKVVSFFFLIAPRFTNLRNIEF
jgi:3-oxoacyl-(acyl-carrier-protein) synthase